ncbi:MAG: ATP-binding protein [Opitutae bacterium]|nr:ATP-binding protein [Opitutae bacterium]
MVDLDDEFAEIGLKAFNAVLLDEIGEPGLPKHADEYLLEVIMRRYETCSPLMTSNRSLEDWGKLLQDVLTAGPILDRFLHHATVFAIIGESYFKDSVVAKTGGRNLPGQRTPAAWSRPAASSSAPVLGRGGGKDAMTLGRFSMPMPKVALLKKPWSMATSMQRPDYGLKKRLRRADFMGVITATGREKGDMVSMATKP